MRLHVRAGHAATPGSLLAEVAAVAAYRGFEHVAAPLAARLHDALRDERAEQAFIDMATGAYDPKVGVGILRGLFALASLIPAMLVDIKRWHDRDKSGWWMLITLVPIIGAIWFLIELGFLASTPGPNRFGPPPTDA